MATVPPLCRVHRNPCKEETVKRTDSPNLHKLFWCCNSDNGCGWNGWINPQPATSSPQTPSRREDPRPEPGSAETLINNTPQIGVHRARVEPASPTRLVGTHRVAAEKDIDEGPFADTSALAAKLDFTRLNQQANQDPDDAGSLASLRGELALQTTQIAIWKDRDADSIFEIVLLKAENKTVKAEFAKIKVENDRVKAENKRMRSEIRMLRAEIEGE
ncbi:hypothetical protein BDV98DRAFT_181656 [Pterulicium gracile]|uniref:Uncharacterized protein n=1 Tax=Pterulicium gracile TaxID=1884261 RepID=A0A5C3QL10_9AGAR|nr:hypothetical protein BDV98DRAFT_181656 [Pterula gracilis]